MAVGHAPLPAVRSTTDLASWRPNVPPVVKGAAVMAAGTIGQFVFRRAVSNFVGGRRRGGGSPLVRIFRNERDGLEDEAQIITETITMKRVRIRRQS